MLILFVQDRAESDRVSLVKVTAYSGIIWGWGVSTYHDLPFCWWDERGRVSIVPMILMHMVTIKETLLWLYDLITHKVI